MNNSERLKEILRQKSERFILLQEKSKQLKDLSTDLSVMKFGRFFGTSYLVIKRILALIIGVALLLGALLLLVYDDALKAKIIGNYEEDYIRVEFVTLEKIFENIIKASAGLFILLGLVLLYISRLTRKMTIRNRRISRAETLTQEIIASFQEVIREEQREMESLRNIIEKQEGLPPAP